MEGVVKLSPVANAEPPVEAENQEIVPFDVAPSPTVPASHLEFENPVTVGIGLMVAVTVDRLEVQPLLVDCTK